MRHLVIGSKGEVGSAIFSLLSEKYEVDGIDRNDFYPGIWDVLHICFPFSTDFIPLVEYYKNRCGHKDSLVIVHSTVPVGTCEQIDAVHSPVRGVHPHLLAGLKAFVKYFGGRRAPEAADIFHRLGLYTYCTEKSANTEALKLWCTTSYGWNIILEKSIAEYCSKHGLDFNLIYTHANSTYNEGFNSLGMNKYARYNLENVPGPIGGHCVIPNCEILGGEIAETILEVNQKLYQEEISA